MQWGDIDIRNRHIVVQRTWTPKGRIAKPKNGKIRQVDLSDAALTALQTHKRELQKQYLKEGKPLPEWVSQIEKASRRT